MKWEYHKTTKESNCVCHYGNPCILSSCGKMIYVYPEQNLRAYLGTIYGTEKLDNTYKIRVNV